MTERGGVIPSSQPGQGAALGFTVAALALVPLDAIEIAGGTGAAGARLGTGVADMAAGTLSTMATHQVVEAATPSETVSPAPQNPLARLPAETTPLAAPELMAALSPAIVQVAHPVESPRPAPRPEDKPHPAARPPAAIPSAMHAKGRKAVAPTPGAGDDQRTGRAGRRNGQLSRSCHAQAGARATAAAAVLCRTAAHRPWPI
ncbi:hypothetical protein [Rhodovulum sp.]|uniref:hypothetical protein n=1 Tax=Rhodovulum sp. TaxID=34009 RepID=UPI00257FFBF4|nr:hypothetical protein [Rhodovulum sp.]